MKIKQLFLMLFLISSALQAQEDSPVIRVRGANRDCQSALYILDGKVIDLNEFNELKPKKIRNIYVVADKQALFEYGKNGGCGVIVMTSLKAKNIPQTSDSIVMHYTNTTNDTLYYCYSTGQNLSLNNDTLHYHLERLPFMDSISVLINNLGFDYSRKTYPLPPNASLYFKLDYAFPVKKGERLLDFSYVFIKKDSDFQVKKKLIEAVGVQPKIPDSLPDVIHQQYSYKDAVRVK